MGPGGGDGIAYVLIRGVIQMQTHCRQRGEGVKKGPKTAYILKERPLTENSRTRVNLKKDVNVLIKFSHLPQDCLNEK